MKPQMNTDKHRYFFHNRKERKEHKTRFMFACSCLVVTPYRHIVVSQIPTFPKTF